MNKEENKETNITDILHKIQVELKAPKNQYNKFGKYNYRSCEDILEAVKKILPDKSFLTISDDVVYIGNRYYVKATATLGRGNSTVSVNGFAREGEDKKGFDDAQLTGASSSYARKYALNGLFCIDDTKDADATKIEEKPIVKIIPVTPEEYTELQKSVDNAKSEAELGEARAKIKACWRRLSKEWQKTISKKILDNEFYIKE